MAPFVSSFDTPSLLARWRWRQNVIHCCRAARTATSINGRVRLRSGPWRSQGRHVMQFWLAFGQLRFFRSVSLSVNLDVFDDLSSCDSLSTVRTIEPFSWCGMGLIEPIATLVATCMRSNVVPNSAIIDHFRRSASLHLIRVQEVQPGELVGNIVNAYGIGYPTPTDVPRSSDTCWQFAHLRRFTVASAMSWDGEAPIKRRSLLRR